LLHENARELPRLAEWPEVASLIDKVVVDVIGTSQPISEILHSAQVKAVSSLPAVSVNAG
jgi:multiple sugar transport system substrate-binding protein